MPFIEKIDKYSIEPNQLNMVIEPAVNGALTKDNQTIGLTMRIVWKYDEDKIVDIAKKLQRKEANCNYRDINRIVFKECSWYV